MVEPLDLKGKFNGALQQENRNIPRSYNNYNRYSYQKEERYPKFTEQAD